MKWILWTGMSLFLSFPAFAIIDMKNANFSTSWTDLVVPGAGYEMKIQRTYNSRTLMNGLFGFGWCSDFETKLYVNGDNTIEVIECGTGMVTSYLSKDHSSKETSALVGAIIEKVKANGKRSKDYVEKLKKDLTNDPQLRSRMALGYEISGSVKEGVVYRANGKEVENVTLGKEYYVRELEDGTFQRFDLEGRLIAMYDKNKNFLKLSYQDKLLKEIVDNNGRRLTFKYNVNKRISTIKGPSGISVEYKFEKLDNLVWVNNAWGNVYTFDYDELHNLTKATWPDKTFIQLTYDRQKDWVMSYKDRRDCKEVYDYQTSKDQPKLHFWSTVEKTCDKKVVNQSKFEFFHKIRSDGTTILQKVATESDGISNEIVYHEVFGKPISIKRAGERISFDYFDNGQLRKKTTRFAILNYEYDQKAKKVSRVKTIFNNEKGQKTAEQLSEFKYDPKGNLIFAKNTEGQQINLTYDPKGRIESILDQAKKLVTITYDEKFGKPATVTRPQMGSIRIRYKSNGEIDKAESPEGPQVAVQVASTFNNLLDVIAPASLDVFN